MSYVQVSMQGLIFLLLILVVLWIYGRERLQRDVYFMLHIRYPSYVVNIVRFIVPIFLFIITVSVFLKNNSVFLKETYLQFVGLALTLSPMGRSPFYEIIAALIIKIVPWIIIPGYMVYSLVRANGSFSSKFKKLNRPTDWYPVEIDDRQRYEAALGNSDISHQLSSTVIEENGLCEEDQD